MKTRGDSENMFNRDDIIAFCESEYGTVPDHPWAKYPENVVLRHRDNRKWFGLITRVPRSKVGLEGDEPIWILNVKCDHLLIQGLLPRDGFAPAYHMNKRNWITVLLDAQLEDDEIRQLLHLSYSLTS